MVKQIRKQITNVFEIVPSLNRLKIVLIGLEPFQLSRTLGIEMLGQNVA